MNKPPTPEIINHFGLMVYFDHGAKRSLGYLRITKDEGIIEPSFGKIDVTTEAAQVHNQTLSRAQIDGLDHRFVIGGCGVLYIRKEDGRWVVETWIGELVSPDVEVVGRVLTFRRKGRTFRGTMHQDEGCFHWRRIS